ncbi:hypothetical protein J6590_061624 [Homalodisca vitripennis]|nr:hypothetical protein J6590_061624 [Homalodisca vitripennis]
MPQKGDMSQPTLQPCTWRRNAGLTYQLSSHFRFIPNWTGLPSKIINSSELTINNFQNVSSDSSSGGLSGMFGIYRYCSALPPLFLSACHDHPIEHKREELVECWRPTPPAIPTTPF